MNDSNTKTVHSLCLYHEEKKEEEEKKKSHVLSYANPYGLSSIQYRNNYNGLSIFKTDFPLISTNNDDVGEAFKGITQSHDPRIQSLCCLLACSGSVLKHSRTCSR